LSSQLLCQPVVLAICISNYVTFESFTADTTIQSFLTESRRSGIPKVSTGGHRPPGVAFWEHEIYAIITKCRMPAAATQL